MADRLVSIGAQSLMETPLDPPVWLVEGLLPTGSTNLLCAPPKTGKSILCLQLCHSVAMGLPFLGRATSKSRTCYLCLEDQEYRLQQRLWQIADESTDDFRLVKRAETLGGGLIGQMEDYLRDYPGTGLFVVDTLQVARGAGGPDYSYSSDYADLRRFKEFADRNRVCLVIVHHLRKAESPTDQFMDISGTAGISGAVDGMLIMKKKRRSAQECRLSATGRDIEYVEIRMRREGLAWEFVEQLSETEAREEAVPGCVRAAVRHAIGAGGWRGTSSQLIEALGIDGVSPAALGKHLSQHHAWMESRGVSYELRRTRAERTIILEALPTP